MDQDSRNDATGIILGKSTLIMKKSIGIHVMLNIFIEALSYITQLGKVMQTAN